MFCNNCGCQLPDDAMFCNQCGYKMPVVTKIEVTECPECGAKLEDNSKFCMKCGTKINKIVQSKSVIVEKTIPCENCGEPIKENMEFCPKCGMYVEDWAEEVLKQRDREESYTDLSMNWYKFLIYFFLIASAVLNLISGIIYMIGGHYDDNADLVYWLFDELKTIDVLMGLYCLGIAVYCIATQTALRHKKSYAPIMLYWLDILNIVIGVLYLYLVVAVTELEFETNDYVTMIVTIAVSLVRLFVNYVYFTRRKEIFIN